MGMIFIFWLGLGMGSALIVLAGMARDLLYRRPEQIRFQVVRCECAECRGNPRG